MQPTLSHPPFRPFRETLASTKFLRACVLPILRRLDMPIRITNPYSGMPFHLRSFTHKGYWFYGRHRESSTMARLKRVVRSRDIVLEVGGHIGYLTQFFALQVGDEGRVHVFEPGTQNQIYLRQNLACLGQTIHVDAAVSDRTGKAVFYEENFGGFMNSLQADFAEKSDIAAAQGMALELQPRKVNTITLDRYAFAHNVWPDVLKIDVEGAELAVLTGGAQVLNRIRCAMIEVSRHQSEIFELLINAGFALSTPDGSPITDPAALHGNIFAVKPH